MKKLDTRKSLTCVDYHFRVGKRISSLCIQLLQGLNGMMHSQCCAHSVPSERELSVITTNVRLKMRVPAEKEAKGAGPLE